MAHSIGIKVFHCLLGLLVAACLFASAHADPGKDYGIAFDAGSSGTRVYVYSWRHRTADSKNHAPFTVPHTKASWSKKSQIPLASFAEDPTKVESLLSPLIAFAKAKIHDENPSYSLVKVPVFLGATAGMRMIPEASRRAIIAESRKYFSTTGLSFVDAYSKILSGEEEALFGWIAVNYMKGTLRPAAGDDDDTDDDDNAVANRRRTGSSGTVPPALAAAATATAGANARAHIAEVADSALPLEQITRQAEAEADAEAESEEEYESLLSLLAPLIRPATGTRAALTSSAVASAAYAAVAHFLAPPTPASASTAAAAAAAAAVTEEDREAGAGARALSLRARAHRALSAAAAAAAAAALPPTSAEAHAGQSFKTLAASATATATATTAAIAAAVEDAAETEMWGALDLGGASTQLTFIPPSDPLANHIEFITPNSGVRHELYAISHLHFGINEAVDQTLNAIANEIPADAATAPCPCFNKGFVGNFTRKSDGKRITFTGSGDYAACETYTTKILGLDSKCFYDSCSVHGAYLPPLPANTRILAFSAFPSITDEAGFPPGFISINDIAARGAATVCTRDWAEAEGKQRNTACLAMAYVASLLGKAYRIDPAAEVVSFELEIDGAEVTWASGYVLYQVNLLEFEGLIKAVITLLIVIIVLAIALTAMVGVVAYLLYQRRKLRLISVVPDMKQSLVANSAYVLQQDRAMV